GGPHMADARLAWLPATELAALIRKKQVSPVEVIGAVLDRIDRINPRLNAFVTLTDEPARREARAAERALMKRGARLGPLHGVPFSVKDLVITRGVRTTFGTDGGGSIRIPASCAGIFGHKASYGRIPTYPVSGAWSLSHIGPLTRTVADAALMLTVCAGPDERDQYSLPGPRVDYVKAVRG